TDLLVTAYQRMKLHDISQLPVMGDDRLVGLVDESDLLLHVYGDEAKFRDPVSTAMASKLDVLDVGEPMEALLPVFERGHVAIVTEGGKFLGLVTRMDLLNHLRRRVERWPRTHSQGPARPTTSAAVCRTSSTGPWWPASALPCRAS